ncbi:MAG: hypothetical protein ABI232_08910 [Jatrophihabitantaceae bacterium]
MTSALSTIPIDRRRRAAATLALFAVLFVAVGAVATTGRTTGVVQAFSATALIIAVLLGLMAWGVLHSVKLDLAEAELDDAINAAITARGGKDIACGCGHDHDMDEMHVTGHAPSPGACAHDGAGSDCAHSCDTCVLTALRPSPSSPRAERLAR